MSGLGSRGLGVRVKGLRGLRFERFRVAALRHNYNPIGVISGYIGIMDNGK